MNGKISFLIVGAFAFISVTIFSCKKQVENEIEGRWMKEAFINSNDADSAIWTFTNGMLYIKNMSDSALSDTGKYLVIEKNLKNYVRVTQLKEPQGYQPYNGDWRVIQYRKDKLTLAKPDRKPGTEEPSGNILREFTRID